MQTRICRHVGIQRTVSNPDVWSWGKCFRTLASRVETFLPSHAWRFLVFRLSKSEELQLVSYITESDVKMISCQRLTVSQMSVLRLFDQPAARKLGRRSHRQEVMTISMGDGKLVCFFDPLEGMQGQSNRNVHISIVSRVFFVCF